MPQLRDPDDLPSLYQSANQASLTAQKRFLGALRIRLLALVTATVGGAVGISAFGIRVGAAVALASFVIALGVESYGALVRPDRIWYEGRAAAESAKTLAWRYVVRGESFESERSGVDKAFLDELREILRDLNNVDLSSDAAQQITPQMRYFRARDFEFRKQLYLSERIEDQRAWYDNKAKWNGRRGHRWTIASLVLQFSGVLAGAVMTFGWIGWDALGIVAAGAATVSAWSQAKQYQNLATAYGITAQELAAVASEGEALRDESQWSDFVGQAEEAISREHTLWRASRGLKVRPRGRGS